MPPTNYALNAISYAYPDFKTAPPRTQQGSLAISRVLSGYGQPDPNDSPNHNWGGFTAPQNADTSCPDGAHRYVGAVNGIRDQCIILFDSDDVGINTFLGAISNDPVISQAVVQGDVMALASALGGSGAFGPQAASVSGNSVNALAAMLGNSVTAIAKDLGQTPDWYLGKDRVDQSPALNSGGQPSNQNTATNTTTPPADASTGPSTGALVAGFGVAALIGYGLYKMSKAGPR